MYSAFRSSVNAATRALAVESLHGFLFAMTENMFFPLTNPPHPPKSSLKQCVKTLVSQEYIAQTHYQNKETQTCDNN